MFNFDSKKIGEQIGKGQSSAVFAYRDDKSDGEWAVKCTVTSSIDEILREIQEMVLGFSCEHPNVLSVKGFYIKVDQDDKDDKDDGDARDDPIWSIYQKIPRMSVNLGKHLAHRKNQGLPFSREEIIKLFYGIASGIEYLHNKMIAHRDIKLENILMDYEGTVKVADFGVVTYLMDKASVLAGECVGSKGYMAPEVEKGEQLKNKELYKADMWSLGIAMLRLCLGVKYDVNTKEFFGKLPEIKDAYGSDVFELIRSLLQHDPNNRVTATHVRLVLEEKYTEILGVVKKQPEQPAQHTQPTQFIHSFKPSSSFEEKKYEEPKKDKIGIKQNQVKKDEDEEHKLKKDLIDEYANFREELEALKKRVDQAQSSIFKFQIAENSNRVFIESKDPETVNRVTDDSLRDLLDDLKKHKDGNTFKNIEGLSFALRYCNRLSNRAIQQLAADISENCNNLHILELDFWGCSSIDDVIIRDMSKHISLNLTKLESLAFFFNECHRVTGAGLMAINRFIFNSIQTLKTVKLNFNNCQQVSNDSVKDLVKQIGKSLKNLESIQLYFDECFEVGDEAVLELAFQISSNLKGISTLVLVLSNCVMVTENAVIRLAENIKNHMANIKRLELGLYGIEISAETKTSIKAYVQNIPNCQIHF